MLAQAHSGCREQVRTGRKCSGTCLVRILQRFRLGIKHREQCRRRLGSLRPTTNIHPQWAKRSANRIHGIANVWNHRLRTRPRRFRPELRAGFLPQHLVTRSGGTSKAVPLISAFLSVQFTSEGWGCGGAAPRLPRAGTPRCAGGGLAGGGGRRAEGGSSAAGAALTWTAPFLFACDKVGLQVALNVHSECTGIYRQSTNEQLRAATGWNFDWSGSTWPYFFGRLMRHARMAGWKATPLTKSN
jgi:hypothetical protein